MNPEAVADVDRVPHGGSEDTSRLDFSANTNPDRPPGVAGVYESALSDATRYRDDFSAFTQAAASYVNCDASMVTPVPGGLAALRLAVAVTVSSGDRVFIPEPGFSEYAREVKLQGGIPVGIAHDTIVTADTTPDDIAAVIICTPNNPTGDCIDPEVIDAFRQRCIETDTTVIIDEAFMDFIDAPSMAGARGTIVARSLTKIFGLPGLRAGFAVADGVLGDRLESARPTWSLSTPAAAVGQYCLTQDDFVRATRERVSTERERLRTALETEYTIFPSDAPFLLLGVDTTVSAIADRSPTTKTDAVDALLAHARENGIELRDARTFETLDAHVRVAIRRPHENDRLLSVLLED